MSSLAHTIMIVETVMPHELPALNAFESTTSDMLPKLSHSL